MTYIDTRTQKPISPHLTIYKPQISSVLSIFHRISGVVNYLGMLIMLIWITSLAFATTDPATHILWVLANSVFGKLMLFGWSLSLTFHFCTGLRHLAWDVGLGFSVPVMNRTGWAAVICAITLTALFWIII